MFDPLTLLMIAAGALAWKEAQRKDFGILTAERDERYRNAMAYGNDPAVLMQEAELFDQHGLKAQAMMLKRRAEWRARPPELKELHEQIYQKALQSKNIQAIVEVAANFEGWTATKKAANLRAYARKLHEEMIRQAAKDAVQNVNANPPQEEAARESEDHETGEGVNGTGAHHEDTPQPPVEVVNDDT